MLLTFTETDKIQQSLSRIQKLWGGDDEKFSVLKSQSVLLPHFTEYDSFVAKIEKSCFVNRNHFNFSRVYNWLNFQQEKFRFTKQIKPILQNWTWTRTLFDVLLFFWEIFEQCLCIILKDHIYRMVIVEGCCTMARSSSLGANCYWLIQKYSVEYCCYFTFTILYIWSLIILVSDDASCWTNQHNCSGSCLQQNFDQQTEASVCQRNVVSPRISSLFLPSNTILWLTRELRSWLQLCVEL